MPNRRKFSASEFLLRPDPAPHPTTRRGEAFASALKQIDGGGKVPTSWQGYTFTPGQIGFLMAFYHQKQIEFQKFAIRELAPLANLGWKVSEGGRTGGRETAKTKHDRAEARKIVLRKYLTGYVGRLTRSSNRIISLSSLAAHLVDNPNIEWPDGLIPDKEELRRKTLKPLLLEIDTTLKFYPPRNRQ